MGDGWFVVGGWLCGCKWCVVDGGLWVVWLWVVGGGWCGCRWLVLVGGVVGGG